MGDDSALLVIAVLCLVAAVLGGACILGVVILWCHAPKGYRRAHEP